MSNNNSSFTYRDNQICKEVIISSIKVIIHWKMMNLCIVNFCYGVQIKKIQMCWWLLDFLRNSSKSWNPCFWLSTYDANAIDRWEKITSYIYSKNYQERQIHPQLYSWIVIFKPLQNEIELLKLLIKLVKTTKYSYVLSDL